MKSLHSILLLVAASSVFGSLGHACKILPRMNHLTNFGLASAWLMTAVAAPALEFNSRFPAAETSQWRVRPPEEIGRFDAS